MMMNIQEIETKLSEPSSTIDTNIYNSIEMIRKREILNQNEDNANYAWCIRQVYIVKNHFLKAYNQIKRKEFECAWHHLERADIELSFLERQTEVDISTFYKRFMLNFIKVMIPRYQKLFPYRLFISREAIIKSEKCSICGQRISIRKKCGHRVGHLYMGESCGYEVTDWELIGCAIVKDPFDKFGYIQPEGLEYNYEMIDAVVARLRSPYQPWFVEIEKIVRPEFKNIKRNDLCPCGSGKKYKKCCKGTDRILTEHHKVQILDPYTSSSDIPFHYVDTWKKR